MEHLFKKNLKTAHKWHCPRLYNRHTKKTLNKMSNINGMAAFRVLD